MRATVPLDGATGVPLDQSITATLSEAMDRATITPGSFTVSRLVGVKAVAAGGSWYGGHMVALKNDGTVVAWGYNECGQTTIPSDLSRVIDIAAGYLHTAALKDDGTVVAWR